MRTRFLGLALAVAFSAFGASAVSAGPDDPIVVNGTNVSYQSRAQNVQMIANDNGGSIIGYAQKLNRMRAGNSLVVFNGQCASACTIFLALSTNRTCILPGATFVFHAAYGASNDMNAWGTNFMMRTYPQWVRNWIESRGGLSGRLIRMDYRYASRYMRTCQMQST